MIIRCKSSKRFLGKVDTETFFDNLKNITGINVEVPLKVELICRKCGMIEVFDVYRNKYNHLKSYKNKK